MSVDLAETAAAAAPGTIEITPLALTSGAEIGGVDLTPTESDRLLAMLKEHAARPEFTVRFKWTPGSVAMWDNRSTTHMGPRDVINTEFAREVHRTTLMGEIPVGVDGRESTAIEGDPIRPM